MIKHASPFSQLIALIDRKKFDSSGKCRDRIMKTGVTVLSGLGFPLPNTIGLIAFFVPGGLGVREGVMSGYLTLSGFSIHSAANHSNCYTLVVFNWRVVYFHSWINSS